MLFRWRKGEHDSFFNKIKRFNNKIKKAIKEGYKHDLPSSINYKEELNNILSDKNYSREQFNKKIKFIDNFLNKNALDIKKGKRGAKIPNWEFKHIKNEILPSINKKRMTQKKKLEEEIATDRGKSIGVKVKDIKNNPAIPDLATNKIRLKNFNWKNMSTNDFEAFKATLWEYDETIEKMDKQMERNYKLAITREFDLKDAKELLKLLDNLPRDLIIKKIYNDLNLGFKFVYSKSDYDIRFEEIKKAWKRIAKDYKKSLRSD